MNRSSRRTLLKTASAAALVAAAPSVHAQPPDRPEWFKTRLAEIDATLQTLKKGQARTLVKSAGGREIHLVAYGPKVERRGTANYNSACGGNRPASYAAKDGTQPPVVMILGPVHGGEVEGIAGTLNLIKIAETGADFNGRRWDRLAQNIARCRLLIVPCGNPDGRARFPWDCSVGRPWDQYQPLAMGLKSDGETFRWPTAKQLHPMKGPGVKTLGAYYNDDGVNLMHDEWFAPMAKETQAFLGLARDEAPDWIVSLHSAASTPVILPAAYMPRTLKDSVQKLHAALHQRYAKEGFPHRKGPFEAKEDGATFPPSSFNLASALHHVCGGAAMVHECCVGVSDEKYPRLDFAQILDIDLLLFDELLEYAVKQPVNWEKKKEQ